MKSNLDRDGYRPNVAIVLMNRQQQFFWAKRSGQPFWQFPQGGVHRHESPGKAMFRELWEEVGLKPYHVRVLGRTARWLHYEVPRQYVRQRWQEEKFSGQKQIWFLLEMRFPDDRINLDSNPHPEFDQWRWDSLDPFHQVAEFKQKVYQQALRELLPGMVIPKVLLPRAASSLPEDSPSSR